MSVQTFYSRAVDGNTIIKDNLTTAGTQANLVSVTGNLWLGTSMYMILDNAPELYEVTKYEKYWYNVASVRRAWLQDGTAGYRVDLEKNLLESFVRDYSSFGTWRLRQPGSITPGQCESDGSPSIYYPSDRLTDPALSDINNDYGLKPVYQGLATSATLIAILQRQLDGASDFKVYTLASSYGTTGVQYNSFIKNDIMQFIYDLDDIKSYSRSPASIKLEVGYETLPLVTNPESDITMTDTFYGDIHQKALKSNGKNILVLGNQTVEIPTTSRIKMDGQSNVQIGVESGEVKNAFGHITKVRIYDKMIDIPTIDVSTPLSQYYQDKLKLATLSSTDSDALVTDIYNGLVSIVSSLAATAATAASKYGGGVISSVINSTIGDGIIPAEYKSNLGYIISSSIGMDALVSPSQQLLDKQGLIGDAFLNNYAALGMYQYYVSDGKLTMPDLSQWLCSGSTLFLTKGDKIKSADFYAGSASGAPADIIAAGKSFAASGFTTI